MTKLYTVSIEYEYVVAVEDGDDQYWVAEEAFRDVKYDMDSQNVSMFVTEMKTIPQGWDDQCYPYRLSGEEKRICEIQKG